MPEAAPVAALPASPSALAASPGGSGSAPPPANAALSPAPSAAVPAVPAAAAPPPPPPPAVQPVPYTFKVPQDSHMDKAALDSFATYAKEKGLSQEHAQLMIDRDHQERAALLKAGNDAMAAEDVRWKAELQSDKEFGGEKFGENAELVKRLFDVGDPDGVFRKGLDDAKLGNNVLLNRFMLRLARKFGIGEDKLAGRGGGEPAPKEPVENRLYPTMREKK